MKSVRRVRAWRRNVRNSVRCGSRGTPGETPVAGHEDAKRALPALGPPRGAVQEGTLMMPSRGVGVKLPEFGGLDGVHGGATDVRRSCALRTSPRPVAGPLARA